MRFFAVIDTNVLVSALLKKGSIPDMLFQYICRGIIVPVFNKNILTEYYDVLYREKFNFPNSTIDFLLNRIQSTGIRLESTDTIDSKNFPDKKDIAFYEVVLTARKSQNAYLVTGNAKHFPEESFVVTARQMLDIIEKTA